MPNLKQRYSGVLLHPSSLPSPYGIGDFGEGAFKFIDFLKKSGQTIWQVLPFGPTGYGDSPYQCFSAFAGQPLFISPGELCKDGFLDRRELEFAPHFSPDSVDYGYVQYYKYPLYKKAFEKFLAEKDKAKPAIPKGMIKGFENFEKNNASWLKDYALFMALKDANGGIAFLDWPEEQAHPSAEGKKALQKKYEKEMMYYSFLQYIFFRQWSVVRAYANNAGIKIVGDIPIFVSMDSADVWANPEMFRLDSKGYPTVVAGVPPDYFSETGQLWGNPLYDWEKHEKTGYAWWISRIKNQLKVFDFIRIDHFRGFAGYWAIPYGDKTAVGGKWVKGPGHSLFDAIVKEFGKDLPIWAEDLGVITDDVEELRDAYGLPGMKVLQFAFADINDNDMMPYRFAGDNYICYTGTHDNDTSLGWYMSLDEEHKDKVRIYMNTSGDNIHWDMIRTAMASTAKYSVYPMQDLLGYGCDCRMNTPAVPYGNWQFRVRESNFNDGLADYLRMLTGIFGRLPLDPSEDEEEEDKEVVEK